MGQSLCGCVISMYMYVLCRFETSDKFLIQPTEASQTLVIDRVSRELSIDDGESVVVLKLWGRIA